jgi:serine/threonine protein kinase
MDVYSFGIILYVISISSFTLSSVFSLAVASSPSVADVAVLAITRWELFALAAPFGNQSNDPKALAHSIINGERPALGAISTDCPPDLRAIISRCWSPNAGDRPSIIDLRVLINDLLRKIDDTPDAILCSLWYDFAVSWQHYLCVTLPLTDDISASCAYLPLWRLKL